MRRIVLIVLLVAGCSPDEGASSSRCLPDAAAFKGTVSRQAIDLGCAFVRSESDALIAAGAEATITPQAALGAAIAADDTLAQGVTLLGEAAFRFSASHFAASGSGYLLSLPYDPAVVPAGGRVVALFADACGVHCAADPEGLAVSLGEPLAVDSARGRVELSATGRQTSLVQLAVLDADTAATLQTDDTATQGEARRSFGLRQAEAGSARWRRRWQGPPLPGPGVHRSALHTRL